MRGMLKSETAILNGTFHGVATTYEIIGPEDGTIVLMLHGWAAHRGLLSPLGQRLATLGYRVHMIDLPGFGDSAIPSEPWSVHDYTKYVLAYLDAQQLNQVTLFGHSFGGRLGLLLGSQHADRITKMVLSNAAGIREPQPWSHMMRLRTYKLIRDTLYQIGLRSLADHLRTAYNHRYGSSDFQNTSGVMRQTFINVVSEDLQHYAPRVRIPTLLIWGEQDDATPLWQGQLLEKLIPDAGLVTYPQAGHYAYLDHLAEVTRVIDYFFSQATT